MCMCLGEQDICESFLERERERERENCQHYSHISFESDREMEQHVDAFCQYIFYSLVELQSLSILSFMFVALPPTF